MHYVDGIQLPEEGHDASAGQKLGDRERGDFRAVEVTGQRIHQGRVGKRQTARISKDVVSEPARGVQVEEEPRPKTGLVPVNIEDIVHGPAVFVVRTDAAARDPLVELRHFEFEVEAMVLQVLAQSPNRQGSCHGSRCP